jgi:hypothetical protein
MKKKRLFGFLLAVILAFTLFSPGLAQKAEGQQTMTSNAGNPVATSPWFVSWADRSTSDNVGAYPSVAYSPIDDLPYISYYDADNGNLMLASPDPDGGNNCGVGGNWWCRIVDDGSQSGGVQTDNVGAYSSIAFWKSSTLPGKWKLGISYYDSTNRALKYALYYKSSILALPTWSYTTIVSSNIIFHNPGTYTSMKFTSDGTPLIAYYFHSNLNLGSGSLNLATQVTSGGDCGVGTAAGKWQCDIIDSATGNGVGQYASLDLRYDDAIYLAYYDAVNGNLRYAWYGGIGVGCTNSEWVCSTVDSAGDVGISASISAPKSVTDVPRIAYYDKTNGKVKYAMVSGACGGAWCIDAVDTIGVISSGHVGISMAMDQAGYPIIAYEDSTPDLAPIKLNIARPAPAVNELIGNCGDVPEGYLFQYWKCNTIDSAGYGQGYVNVASYTSVAVSPSGLAIIAYLEEDDYYLSSSLKIAYQNVRVYLPLVRR